MNITKEIAIICAAASLLAVGWVADRKPWGPSVSERLATIDRDCVAKNRPAGTGVIHYNGMTSDQVTRSYEIYLKARDAAVRHCIGLALERDPEAATVWTNIHGKVD